MKYSVLKFDFTTTVDIWNFLLNILLEDGRIKYSFYNPEPDTLFV